MDVPAGVAGRLDFEAAVAAEIEYRLPYLPPSILNQAVAPHTADAARRFAGLYRAGTDITRAEILQVPKRRGGLRPVAVVDLATRVLLRALCDQLDPYLPAFDRSWEAKLAFERAPLEVNAGYVVIADVAGFYDFVDHAVLEEELVAQTGDAELVELTATVLRDVMGRQFGLPQVLHASNVLSESYIDVAERRLLRSGLGVWRQNDDFRLVASSWREANSAFEALDRALRELGLTLNEHKCFILTSHRYSEWLAEPERRWQAINEEVEIDLRAVGGYAEDGEAEIEIADVDVVEAAAVVALELALGDVEGADRLQEEVNRQLAGAALRTLRLVSSGSALPRIAEVMNREPQFAAEIARYLAAASSVDERAVAEACLGVVQNPNVHLSHWQSLWLLEAIRALTDLPQGLSHGSLI